MNDTIAILIVFLRELQKKIHFIHLQMLILMISIPDIIVVVSQNRMGKAIQCQDCDVAPVLIVQIQGPYGSNCNLGVNCLDVSFLLSPQQERAHGEAVFWGKKKEKS